MKRPHSDLDSWYLPLIVSLFFGLPLLMISIAMNVSLLVMITMTTPSMQVVLLCINIPIIIFTGYRYYKAAWMGARHGAYGMDALIVVGTTLSFFFSCFLLSTASNNSGSGSGSDGDDNHNRNFFVTSGMLVMFVTIGKFIEGEIIVIVLLLIHRNLNYHHHHKHYHHHYLHHYYHCHHNHKDNKLYHHHTICIITYITISIIITIKIIIIIIISIIIIVIIVIIIIIMFIIFIYLYSI